MEQSGMEWNSGLKHQTVEEPYKLFKMVKFLQLKLHGSVCYHQTIRPPIDRQSVSQILLFPPETAGPRLDLYDFH